MNSKEFIKFLFTGVEQSWLNIFTKNENCKKHVATCINNIYCHYVENNNNYEAICPSPDKIFEAFRHFSVQDTVVIIIGQDPYYTKGVANGLSFSHNQDNIIKDNSNKGNSNNKVKIQPSLRNIFKCLAKHNLINVSDKNNVYDKEVNVYNKEDNNPSIASSSNTSSSNTTPDFDKACNNFNLTGDLMPWVKQGVLLMNKSLTTLTGKANAHPFWNQFTDEVMRVFSDITSEKIFVLWGNNAQKLESVINKNNGHHILKYSHPSPLAARPDKKFEDCTHFIDINNILRLAKKRIINWDLSGRLYQKEEQENDILNAIETGEAMDITGSDNWPLLKELVQPDNYKLVLENAKLNQ